MYDVIECVFNLLRTYKNYIKIYKYANSEAPAKLLL